MVCGTGFTQQLPFFDDDLQARLTDDRANFELYRHIQPLTCPTSSFAGYNSSFFSPLSAELASVWIASLLTGRHQLPEPAARQREVTEMLRWMEERTEGRHARGTNIIPFSMHNIDDLLADLGVRLGAVTRAAQWLLPIDPGSYRTIADRVRQRPSTTAIGPWSIPRSTICPLSWLPDRRAASERTRLPDRRAGH